MNRKDEIRLVVLALLALVFGYLRVFGHSSTMFQGFAHIYVGGLFGAAFVSNNKLYWLLASQLTICEIICHFALK